MDTTERVRSDFHLERCETKVKDLERAAVLHARKGRFVDVIDDVEENVTVRARWGSDSPLELVGMLQASVLPYQGTQRVLGLG
jgi:hypothetical protein